MIRPEMDGSDAAKNLLDNIYHGGIEDEIILPDDAVEWVDAYFDASVEEDNAKAKKQEATNHIKRVVPMLDMVRDALLQEKEYQSINDLECKVTVDAYTDFIFINRFGNVQHQGTLNKALRRIIRDCNDEVLEKNESATVLLPRFSCHILRHTFTTRLIEAGVNPKVVQDTLGHKDISTTLGIYASVTNEFKKSAYDTMAVNNSDVWKI